MKLNYKLPKKLQEALRLSEGEEIRYCSPYDLAYENNIAKKEYIKDGYVVVTNLRLVVLKGEEIVSEYRLSECEKIVCEPLIDNGKSLACSNRHSFDKAAQGYVHLLTSNKMNSKIPGDSKEMVAARTAFLSLGFYHPFREGLCRIVCDNLKGKERPVLLDAGCGEGYYTSELYRNLSQCCTDPVVCGFDISKFAVKAAARDKNLSLSVASCFDIPLADSSVDALTAVFSPIVPEEFARVVKPGGIMVLAVASPRHLMGLKQLLYDTPYENERRDTD
ncbi:MAG: methyltransferase domain-containing protein, partial [Lachnospiraceae bacterium]|nr:methyltransferase domain-containing protein [Lachnospiraceae bacterium]